MTTTRNRSKNKKMKLYKNIEGGVVGRLKINEEYLIDRIQYTYRFLFKGSKLFEDGSSSPIYFLGSSGIGQSNSFKEGYQEVMGSTISITGNVKGTTTTYNTNIRSLIPFSYTSELYKRYITGDFTRGVKYEYQQASTEDQMMVGLSGMAGRKDGSLGTYKANYDEFLEKTNPDARLAVLIMKQFDAFMDYVNLVGKEYKQGILRFIKENMTKAFPVGEDIDYNEKQTKTIVDSKDELLRSMGAKEELITENKKTTSYYGDLPPPPDDADASMKSIYNARIKNVNTTIYNTFRNQVTDNPNNPSLIIPSPFWFFGDIVKVANDLDVRTTLPQSLYTETLALQKVFEEKIFNAKAPMLIKYLVLRLKEVYDEYIAQGQYIDEVMDASNAVAEKKGISLDGTNPELTDTDRLKAEYDRQVNADESINLVEKAFNADSSLNNTAVKIQTVKGIKYVSIKTKDIVATGNKSAYQQWLTLFVRSEEYPEFVNAMRSDEKKISNEELRRVENVINPTLDLKELQKTKTFYNADVFEEDDPDSINYDLTEKLREQEDSFNKVISELKAPFDLAQEEQKKKNEVSLEALKAKIKPTEDAMYKELDKAMATNKQNRVDRKNEEVKTKLAEKDIEEEDSALASLKNYKSCSSGAPRQPPPPRVYQDANIQDIIKKSSNALLAGGNKRLSIAQQVYLLNKRYIGDYDGEGPLIKYNSAKKEGGATDKTNTQTYTVDPSLNIQGATVDYIDYSELQKEVDDMNMATEILNMADNFVGFIPVVGDLLSAGIAIANMVMAEEIAKKEREMEEKRIENERLLDSFFSWKENMQEQMVITLSTQEDPTIYAKLKKIALDTYRTIDPNNPPSRRDVQRYSNYIDNERNNIITTRKNITDQMTQNSTDILGVIADTLDEQDNEKTALIDEGFQARKTIVDEFTTKLKDYTKKYVEEEKVLNKEDDEAEEQADEVNRMVEEKQDVLEAEAEDVAQLKGYSGCKSNVKSNDQMRDEALEELKSQQAKQEEDIAQGKAPVQGMGKRYKKNSIANQVYLLNMRYINSF